jgi:hypothetical protein
METWSRVHLEQKAIQSRTVYGQYLRRVVGEGVLDATMRRTGAVFGEVTDEAGRAIGMGAQVAAGTQRGEAIADYYARLHGVPIRGQLSMSEAALRARWEAEGPKIPFEQWVENLPYKERQPRIPLVARFRPDISILGRRVSLSAQQQRLLAKGEVAGQFLRARAATTAARLNVLLTKPFELPIARDILPKIPFVRGLRVKRGSHTQMMAGYVKKGMIAGGILGGLSYYDYLRSQGGPAAVGVGTIGGAVLGGMAVRRPTLPFSPIGAAVGGALGLFTAISPRFEKGLFHGAASYVTDANLLRAKASQAVGLQESLRTQEEVTPGLISPKTLIGFTGVGALTAGLAGYGKLMYEGARAKARVGRGQGLDEIIEGLRTKWYGKPKEPGTFGQAWQRRVGSKLKNIPVLGKHIAGIRTPMAAGAMAGAAAWLAASTVLPIMSGNFMAALPVANLLGTEESPEELQAIYSGEKEIPVRKGRWWEFGRSTAYEGGRIMYYRPHFLHRLGTRAYQTGMWGSEEEKWEHEPLLHPVQALFGGDEWKYAYEIEHQYDRPAPLTGTYGEDIPFIGPLVAATFGKLVKPRKYVRPEEWMTGEGEYLHRPGRPETEPAYELGGLPPGAPVLPEEGSQLWNEMLYRRREAIGLVGFAAGAMEKSLTGREEVFPNRRTLGTMGRETSSEYWLWQHLNLGGGALTTEPIRRFVPHRRHYLDEYNRLEAETASWLPKGYFIDMEHGNLWDKIPEAEIRLPGAGYAALHPEVAGLHPNEYPLMHRLKILGDIAMWSKEYKGTLGYAMRHRGDMTERELEMLDTVQAQVQAKKRRREFDDQRFREDELETMSLTVREILGPRSVLTEELGETQLELLGVGAVSDMDAALDAANRVLQGRTLQVAVSSMDSRRFDLVSSGARVRGVALLEDSDYGEWMAEQGFAEYKPLEEEFEQLRYGPGERMAGGMWDQISSAAETPYEMLTPLSPAAKFIRRRTAIQEYALSEAIGTQNAFWDRPWDNFIGPAVEMAEYKLGDPEIPDVIRERRAIEEYFDMLAYEKAEHRQEEAEFAGDYAETQVAQESKARTLFGMDPFGSPPKVMTAMPRRQRDFFSAFVNARTEEDRQQIMGLVSHQEQRIYASQWMRQQAEAIQAKQQAGVQTQQDAVMLNQIMMARKSDGYEYDEALEQQWMEETGGQIPFDEWLRRKKKAQYFRSRSLPGPDWIGWHPAVDLKDIEARYLQTEGMDHHDYDLWEDRMRSLARKPYISPEAIGALAAPGALTSAADTEAMMVSNARTLEGFMNSANSDIMISTTRVGAPIGNSYHLEIKDSRERLIEQTLNQLGS